MYFTKPNTTKINTRRRINILLLVFILLFGVIAFRLFTIQVIDSEKYKISAKKQYETKIVLYPSRGLIFDRNMNLLVSNSYNISIAADPNMINKHDEIAEVLSDMVGNPKSYYIEKLNTPNTSFVYLDRKIAAERVSGLDTLKYDGLIILKEPSRVYNYGSSASQILGFTNNENEGQTGIERTLNRHLSGTDGFMIMQRDGKGNLRPATEFPRKEPIKGNNIVLTIDINLQRIAEEEISKAAREHKAAGGRVVIMSVKTGEILAMASYPSYDPTNIKPGDSVGFKNSVISDLFEPGSTFKIVTVAASLEEGVTNMNSIIQTEGGIYEVDGSRIRDSYASDQMSFQRAIEQSSNVGMIKIANKLGKERFYKYSRDFGFGILSGIELTGESRGMLKRPLDFSQETLSYLSIGYQVSVNTLQMASAYSCIANNGLFMKPYIVSREFGLNGEVIYENKPSQVRQVVSTNTAKIITQLLTGVVQRGTGMEAAIDGMLVAGKTGTSQKLVNGRYSSNHHLGSFIGYFPSEDPSILIAVILDDPRSGSYYGGKISAPVFKRIATRLLEYKSVNELYDPTIMESNDHEVRASNIRSSDEIFIPNLNFLSLSAAESILKENSLPYSIMTENGTRLDNTHANQRWVVVLQDPAPNQRIKKKDLSTINLIISSFENDSDEISIPNISGMSLRNAINKLIASGFEVEINGSGGIVSQYPPAGSKHKAGTRVTIYCSNNL